MSVSIRAFVDAQDMARVNRILRSVDTSLTDELRSSMKRGILPVAEMIAKRANSYSVPMSGFSREGVRKPNRTQWGALRVSASKISVTPGRSRKSPSLVTINFDGKKAVGLVIAENAGTKTGGNGLRGQLFVARINAMVPGWQNGGRYLYRAFMPYQSHVYRLGESILQRWISKTNMELEAR
jgi:hypothetical protein